MSQHYISPQQYTNKPEIGNIFFVHNPTTGGLDIYCHLPADTVTIVHGISTLEPGELWGKTPLAIGLYIDSMPYSGSFEAITSDIQYFDHYSVDSIRPGTFSGTMKANANNQAADTSLLRNSRVVLSDTDPDVEGEIVWVCK